MSNRTRRTLWIACVSVIALSGLCAWALRRAQAQSASTSPVAPTALQGEAALTQLKQEGHYDSLQAAMRQARYTVSRANSTPLGRAAWHAPNSAQGYDGYVTEDGVSIALKNKSYVSLTLRGIGYGYGLQYVGGGEVSGDKQTIRIERDGQWKTIREWYVNSESGLEQGFTLTEPPSGGKRNGHKLRLAFNVSEGWRAVASDDGQRITLLGQEEGEAVEYGKLVIWDAHGSPVNGALLVEEERVIIEVDDANAAYPLTIDPTFALQQKLTAADGAANDNFGVSVALSGETAVVGARLDDVNFVDQGSAYVFVRYGATWTQQTKLTAGDGAAGDNFGTSAAISGDTIVVGAYADDVGANADQGSAYVFVRSGTTWIQQAKLTAADGADGDNFGVSVALSGATVVVGAFLDDVGANVNQGSAYAFLRNGTTWAQQQRLVASDGLGNDRFGLSVGISGETAVVGAYLDDVNVTDEGSAYVFVRSGTTWTQQQRLTAGGFGSGDGFFGHSVAISGETIVVGADGKNVFNGIDFIVDQGDAFVFTRSGTVWTLQQRLTAADGATGDQFGFSVVISGDTLVVTAWGDDFGANANQGSAYVFTRSGTVWTQAQKLTAADGAAGDFFGVSVAISGETVMIGAYNDDVGANADQGSLSVFIQAGLPVVAQAKLTAPDGAAFDNFGVSVAISGDTAVVGAFGDSVNFTGQGSAYVFVRSGTVWTLQQKLTAADGADGDEFGISVAISGDTVVVGARYDNVGVNADQGSAYVFVRSGTIWTQQAKLTASNGVSVDQFGRSVAISGDTVAVGAPYDDVGAEDQGSAYVFVRSGVNWSEQAQLTDPYGTEAALLGTSVAISGDILVAGAPNGGFSTGANKGLAYVFDRSGTFWYRRFPLTASDGVAGDYFGYSVAISGNTVAVGAFFDDTYRGSAYVFTGSGSNWTQQQKLTATDGLANDRFGFSVAINGDLVVVGAQFGDGAIQDQGAAYEFTRSGTNWTQQQKLTAADGAQSDFFGHSVAISGETLVIGATSDDSSRGSVYVYVPCRFDLSPASSNIPVNGGGSGFTISCAANCAWTASALPAWITITSSASGTGNGTISFTVAANSGLPRTSSISVSGSSFVVSQAGTCALTLNPSALPGGITSTPYNQTLTASGGNGNYSYQLINATTLPPGLSLSAGGVITGTPTVGSQGNYTFTVAAVDTNGCVGSRTYTMNIAACAVTSLSPMNANIPAAGGAFNFTVTAPGCAWTTLSHASWLTVTTNPSGTGNLVVGYTVAATVGAARTGLITVNNLTFTVNQAAGAGLQYYPLAHPIRLYDTRASQGGATCAYLNQRIPALGTLTRNAFVTCDGVTIPNIAQAIVGNATIVNPSGAGFATLWPDGQAQPAVSNLNYVAGDVTPNGFTVGLSATGNFNAFSQANTDLIVDITGYYAPPSASGLYYHPLPKPIRLFDSRPGQTTCLAGGTPLLSGTQYAKQARITCDGVTIPPDASAIVGNATVVQPGGPGFATLWPDGQTQPAVSNLNYLTGQVVPNNFTVGLGATGEFRLLSQATTHMIVDVAGYFSPSATDVNGLGLYYVPLGKPIRLFDTRASQGGATCEYLNQALTGGGTLTKQARITCDAETIISTAQAVIGNGTVVSPGGPGFATLWPNGLAQPAVSNLNYVAGQVVANGFTLGLGATGEFRVFSQAPTHFIVDLSGYFAP